MLKFLAVSLLSAVLIVTLGGCPSAGQPAAPTPAGNEIGDGNAPPDQDDAGNVDESPGDDVNTGIPFLYAAARTLTSPILFFRSYSLMFP